METYNPELEIDNHEQSELVSLMSHPGFRVWIKLKRYEVNKYITVLLNTDATEESKVIERFRQAKLAAQLFEGEVKDLNGIRTQYIGENAVQGRPIDLTEGMLDLGAYTSLDEDLSEEEG